MEIMIQSGETYTVSSGDEWRQVPESVVLPPGREMVRVSGVWLSTDLPEPETDGDMIKSFGMFLEPTDLDCLVVTLVQAMEFQRLCRAGLSEEVGRTKHLNQANFDTKVGGHVQMYQDYVDTRYMRLRLSNGHLVVQRSLSDSDIRVLAESLIKFKVLHNLYAK